MSSLLEELVGDPNLRREPIQNNRVGDRLLLPSRARPGNGSRSLSWDIWSAEGLGHPRVWIDDYDSHGSWFSALSIAL